MVSLIVPKTIKIAISIIIALFAFILRGMYGTWNNTNMNIWFWISLIIWVMITALWGWFAFYSGKI